MVKKNISSDEVETHLSKLSSSLTKFSKEISERDVDEKTVLQIAVDKQNFKTIQVLLSFDVSIDTKVGGRNVIEYSKTLLDKNPCEPLKKIYALLKSRGQWQSAAVKNQDVLFARSMKTIVDAVNKISGAVSKTGLLFLGITGEGKSTFINYLNGTEYKSERIKGRSQVIATNKEIAKVGDSTTSETLLPQIIEIKEIPQVFVDLPGFEDTRGTAEEICAAATISMLTKQLKDIQSILLVCSWNTLSDTRMVNYRRAAQNIGAMISKDKNTKENVILLITKPYDSGGKIELEDVVSRLEELRNNENWEEDFKDIKREDVSDDVWRKYCLKIVTDSILDDPQKHIIIGDVLKRNSRDEFFTKIKKASHISKNPENFDFANYSRFMNKFILVMEEMIVNYNDLARKEKSQTDKIVGLKNSIKLLEDEKTGFENSIKKSEEQIKTPFTAESFDKKIQEETKQLKDLREKVNKQSEILRKAQTEAEIKQNQLKSFQQDGEKLIDRITNAWICEKTEDRVEKELETLGEVKLADGRIGREVRLKEKKIEGTLKTVSEAVNYNSPVPVSRFVDNSRGGSFQINNFIKGATKISGIFQSAKGVQGAVSLNVELFGDLKDFPETKEKINQLNQEFNNAQSTLDKAKIDTIPEKELEEAQENLRKLELEKLAAVGNHERTKEVCNMQIKFDSEKIMRIKEKIEGLSKHLVNEELELSDLKLQLEVNQDLFDKLREIIKVMNFKGEVLDQFMDLSKK